MRKRITSLLREESLAGPFFLAAFFFILTAFLLLAAFFGHLPPEVPLFYSHPWGEEQLANPILLFLLPGGAALCVLANFSLAAFFIEEKFFVRILALLSALTAFLALFGSIRILRLVL